MKADVSSHFSMLAFANVRLFKAHYMAQYRLKRLVSCGFFGIKETNPCKMTGKYTNNNDWH
ncbi:hypothetical protein SHAM105786_03090 [Shewanella amazonensis]|uniref:hypothetical protein n=1 Tax=Shewanella amazonensis TaxID=60478 RepID=UPI00059BE051|nr:hypothetical protein [Shewanella amazonensis]